MVLQHLQTLVLLQIIDGVDNASPGLNFALGNLLGMSELDVKTVELLPGASSALYGANAFNGIMFMTSKSAFDDQGISISLKGGITSQEAGGDNGYKDFNIRMQQFFDHYLKQKQIFHIYKVQNGMLQITETLQTESILLETEILIETMMD